MLGVPASPPSPPLQQQQQVVGGGLVGPSDLAEFSARALAFCRQRRFRRVIDAAYIRESFETSYEPPRVFVWMDAVGCATRNSPRGRDGVCAVAVLKGHNLVLLCATKGYGGRTLRAVLDWFRVHTPYPYMHTTAVNLDVARFYAHHGFDTVPGANKRQEGEESNMRCFVSRRAARC